MPEESDRNEDFEVQLVHEERQAYIGSMVPVMLMFAVMVFIVQLKDLRLCCIITVCAILIVVLNTAIMLNTRDKQQLLKRAVRVGYINHTLRTLVHVLFLVMANESVFMLLVSLFLQPLSGARQSHDILSFSIYLLVHNLLTLYRFSGDLEDELPWILATVISTPILLEIAMQKHNGETVRYSLFNAYKTIGRLAQTSSLRMLRCFCDAVIVVGQDFKILEPSSSLGDLLSRNITAGTIITDLLDMSERQQFREYMALLERDMSADLTSSDKQHEAANIHGKR